MIKLKGKKAVQGKDVDHKDRNPANRSPSNLRIQSKKENRGRNK
ncbi:HNH endonuclease [Microbulbifer sp. JMSA002]